MDHKLSISFNDSIVISFAVRNLKAIMNNKDILKTSDLNQWFINYEKTYAKYIQTASKRELQIKNVIFKNNLYYFFHVFKNKVKTIAEYYANHFCRNGSKYKLELEHLDDSSMSYDDYNKWILIMDEVVDAADFLNKYVSSDPDIMEENIIHSAQTAASISQKYIDKKNKIKRQFDEANARHTAECILAKLHHYQNELDEVINKCTKKKDIIEFDIWKEKLTELYNDICILKSFTETYAIDSSDNINLSLDKAEKFYELVTGSRETTLKKIEEYNRFIEQACMAIQPVEGRMLDEQQLESIINDDDNQLIIAGAGTGKTTTIIGKVKFLLKTNKCTPKEILLLSFTNKSASEMKERVKNETGFDMDVMTFHKLGLEIIAGTDKKRPTIYSKSVQEFARTDIKKYINDHHFRKDLLSFLFFSPSKYKTPFDFSTKHEYDEYIDANPPITLRQERVKSYCEMEIANFLYTNNISYTYERVYEFDTANEVYSGYHPDFYLDDYGIYIEFYAVDKNGNVPEYFSAGHGGTGQSEYISGIEWKQMVHKQNNTKLVELSYADKQDDKLIDRLKEKLLEYDVKFAPMSEEEIWDDVNAQNTNIIYSVCDIIGTAITLAKSKGYDMEKLREICRHRNIKLLRIIAPIFKDYSEMLTQSGQIDFNDMIFKAAEYVRTGKATHDYKYVIVDEYQDISMARFTLLDELRKKSFYKLFCVGDDWQSIYRFAGSDIRYILNFEYYWGKASISKIETTYRFSRQLIEISGYFVMQNPNQVTKALKSNSEYTEFPLGLIKAYNNKYLMRFMEDKIYSLPKNSTVFFIGRYTFDKEILKDSAFNLTYNNISGIYEVTYPCRPDLKIEFMTAHKSKGLQADYVFILNNKNKGMGFPSKLQDDPLIQQLLNGSDNYPYSEERRLFYVALTRAKKKLWLLILQDNESIFAKELMQKYDQEIKSAEWTCPLCGGRLIKRNGKNGEFIGCSNFSKKGCRYTRNI